MIRIKQIVPFAALAVLLTFWGIGINNALASTDVPHQMKQSQSAVTDCKTGQKECVKSLSKDQNSAPNKDYQKLEDELKKEQKQMKTLSEQKN
ncbi:hypothetical protein [Vibrio viridaestus]|uniref:DUF1090 domain-containing protein n=1 Tax=Vibrio viridaestus TaxID=2487322 RepID=A0A3N9U9F1_9VIBR|nr:hypothetical protein [Vibrio viridaestus]RQW64836.1 hypothetical protein EES38_02000 [Vibrio viridaestus]